MQIYKAIQVHGLTNLKWLLLFSQEIAFSIFIIYSLPVNVCFLAFIFSWQKSVKKYQGFQESS